MIQALIESGFVEGSSEIRVSAGVVNGSEILVFDDETKVQIGSGVIADGYVDVTVSPVLYLGQRIIAYVESFGSDTFGAVIVVETDEELTGWLLPETVDGQPYEEYLEAGGLSLPEVYSPSSVRNISRDKDAIDRVIEAPITFRLRLTESMAGTVQVSVEDIQGAIGGYKTKFDSDAEGTATTKSYSSNGTGQVKVWGANQTIADAVTKMYDIVVPVASVEFGTNVVDLFSGVDFGNVTNPGNRPITLLANTTVPVEFQIDGVFTWESGILQTSISWASNIKWLPAGEYTIRVRNAASPSEALSREIKLSGY